MGFKKYRLLYVALLLVFIAGCSGNKDIKIPEQIASIENLKVFELSKNSPRPISFDREISYEAGDEVLIGRINSIAADSRGNLYVADDEQKTIHLFDNNGTYIQSFGKKGKGPGEFLGLNNLSIKAPYLYIHDYRQNRLNLFDLETRNFTKAIKLRSENINIDIPPRFRPSGYKIIPDSDTLLISFTQSVSMDNLNKERYTRYYKMDLEGKYIPKKILETKSAQFLADRTGNSFMVMPSPFGRRPFSEITSDGTLFTAWSENFVINRYNQSGEQEGAWYYSNFQKAPLTQEEALNERENSKTYQRIVKNMDLPDTWPTFDKLLLDDKNRLWIATVVEDKTVYRWWIMDTNGEPLATFTWPRSRSIETIKHGKAYVKETEDSGLSKIVRYKFSGI